MRNPSCYLLAVIFSLFLFGCDEPTTGSTATISNVTVSPSTATVNKGATRQFSATVTGRNNPSRTVTWTVNGVTGTTISTTGLLTVSANETASTLIVKATSTVDTTKSGTATVTVTGATASVTNVTVNPSTATVNKGATRQFSATVTGQNNPSQTVTWSVNGVTATGISAAGLLTVASGETASTITVRATSTVDTTKFGTATVTVSSSTNPTNPTTPTDNRILNPATQTTQLTNSSFTPITSHGGGNKNLPSPSPYGYETWDETGSPGTASFRWYGATQGGGAAFYATWTNPKDFLARVGYFWNTGNPYTFYGNVYCGFNFRKSGRYNGNFSYIGIYGWSRNPLVEYYIVEDSYGNQYRDAASYIANINETIQGTEMTSYTLDGSVYKVYRKDRNGPSIEGGANRDFRQFFSVRQTPRQSGTVSITEHFKEWAKQGMNLGSNMYECKFKVEAGGNENASPGTGWFDASFIQFYRTNNDGTIIQITP